jgi:hypothetical protein
MGVIYSMNASYIGSVVLATGQSVPFTGSWVDVSEARNAMLVVFGSGVTSNIAVTLQADNVLKSYNPIFDTDGASEGVPFYTFSQVTNGYSSPAFLDSPIAKIRAVATSGTGQVFAFANIQN